MAMQAHEMTDATSGTFPTTAEVPLDVVAEAHRLACEVERLLTPATDGAMQTEAYGRKIARAMARSLIDQLSDLARDTKRRLA
jgi:hypothetical protein